MGSFELLLYGDGSIWRHPQQGHQHSAYTWSAITQKPEVASGLEVSLKIMDPTSTLFIFVAASVAASPQPNADQALLNAYLKQSGIEKQIIDYGKKVERQQIPKNIEIKVGYLLFVSKTLIEKRITIQWGF